MDSRLQWSSSVDAVVNRRINMAAEQRLFDKRYDGADDMISGNMATAMKHRDTVSAQIQR